jgi:uncharacterized membrane protein
MYFQAGPPFIILILVVLVLLGLFIVLPVSLVATAFGKLGLTGPQGLAVFLLTIVGSRWNLPLYRSTRLVRGEPAPASRLFGFSGQLGRMRFGGIPFQPLQDDSLQLSEQTVAVNVGGCIVPCLLSAWFVWNMHVSGALGAWLILCVLIPALACYLLARPMPGIGIGVPVLLPPAVAAMTAILLAPDMPGHDSLAPRAAYMAGALGTLLGADIAHLLNRRTLAMLDAPLLSIGGAGTFDGIFLAGIIAVLLA